MEKTIVQFILENIFLFLPIGLLGLITTLLILFFSKKETTVKTEDVTSDYVTVFRRKVNIYFFVYFFIWIGIILIGLASQYILPTVVGGIIAAVPLILQVLIEYKTKKSRVI
ncbi:MAG: hypothetical protein JW840_06730 [Candidatus Thermoplasmatota archaeon]|nr:hypothetical protein [Candidatus Thermoplasmatota archaeon]